MPDSSRPRGLGVRGRRLWDAIAAQDPDLSAPLREVALEACRVADRLERLEVACAAVDPVVGGRVNPAFAEARAQATALRQLVATLRLPDGSSGKRPQRRQTRGTQQTRVSASERMRRLAEGA